MQKPLQQGSFLELAVQGVQKLQPYLPGKPIAELQRELGLHDVVKLASNENPCGPSEKVVAALQASLGNLHFYPDGSCFELKQLLADKLQQKSNQITLGNGSNELIELIARTFVAEGQEVIYSEYAFIVYDLVAQAIGAVKKITPAKNWGHDLDAMQSVVSANTRLIFIANPNNPTGTWVAHQAVENLLANIPASVIVVIDEAYFEYVENPDYPNSLALQKKYPNLIILRTFSKAYGLAGLRVGYCIAHADITELLNRVRQPFNVNSLAQIAAVAALQDEAYLERTLRFNRAGLQQLQSSIEKLGLSYIPSVANFLTVEFNQEAMPIYQQLLQKGIIVRPVANYGMPKHLRVSVGLQEQNERFLSALKFCL